MFTSTLQLSTQYAGCGPVPRTLSGGGGMLPAPGYGPVERIMPSQQEEAQACPSAFSGQVPGLTTLSAMPKLLVSRVAAC